MTPLEIRNLIQQTRIEIGEPVFDNEELEHLINFLDYIWKDEDLTEQEKIKIIHDSSINLKGFQ